MKEIFCNAIMNATDNTSYCREPSVHFYISRHRERHSRCARHPLKLSTPWGDVNPYFSIISRDEYITQEVLES